MKAIILAAGRGTRLGSLTLEKPKCLLEVKGKTIIDRLVDGIRAVGIEDVLFVVGHKKEVLMDHFQDQVRFKEYKDYEKTNNLHTLWSIKEELNDDFMCFFADIVVEEEILQRAKDSEKDFCLLVDTGRVLEGTQRVITEGDQVKAVGTVAVEDGTGNFIGMAKFSKTGAKKLLQQMEEMVSAHENDYYTVAIDHLAKNGEDIGFVDVKDLSWAEVDTPEDLDLVKEASFVR